MGVGSMHMNARHNEASDDTLSLRTSGRERMRAKRARRGVVYCGSRSSWKVKALAAKSSRLR